jgi:hypothetical protein
VAEVLECQAPGNIGQLFRQGDFANDAGAAGMGLMGHGHEGFAIE